MSLNIFNLGKTYNNRRVIRDISLSVSGGEIVGLFGPNGTGKTTCFYMIVGLNKPSSGYVTLDGKDITDYPVYLRARLGIGYLPQDNSTFRGLTVAQNIMMALEFFISNLSDRYNRLEELMVEFAISHLRDAQVNTLSGGERKRLEIARCLATNPKYILLDEPLAGIDPIAITEIKEILSALRNQGTGILMTDHNIKDALSIMDRVYVMHDGVIIVHGTPQEILQSTIARNVYFGESF